MEDYHKWCVCGGGFQCVCVGVLFTIVIQMDVILTFLMLC